MSYPSSYYDINPIHDTVHLQQMRDIAKEQIELLVPAIASEICNQIIGNAFSALSRGVEYDCKSILDIHTNSLSKQWHSEETQKYLGQAVIAELKKNIDNFDIKLIIN